MPKPQSLIESEITLGQAYYPSGSPFAGNGLENTIFRGSNVWVRPGGRVKPAMGLLETNSTNVGARIFAADVERATIAGALVGDRLPYAGLLRFDGAVLFFVSEETSAQVYLDEAAASGVTTSTTAGRLRIAVPDGVGGYSAVVDAGFDKPLLPTANVAVATSVDQTGRDMAGLIGVALAPWRVETNAIGPPSLPVFVTATSGNQSVVRVTLPSAVSGQTGWIYCGTAANDRSGALREVRRVRLIPRGTFTATNGSPTLSAGVDTKFTADLRRSDQVVIDGTTYGISSVESDTSLTLTANFTGLSGGGKTISTINSVDAAWLDSDLDVLLQQDIIRPPRCAGVLSYSGRVFVWGCLSEDGSAATGPMIFPTLDNNPEHCSIRGIRTASGSDIVNVLGGDGPLYIMTTTSLEVVSFTGDPDKPFNIRIISEPGFQATTNGALYTDTFYGYNGRPIRTRADENIDVNFAAPVWSDMEDWNPERVVIGIDTANQAVLYCHDNGTTTEVIPYLANLGRWSPPLNFDARIIDTQVVNGTLYLTYLSGGNYRVNQWEGGAGIGGSPYAATRFLDPNYLRSSRLKRLAVAGQLDSLSVYTIEESAAIPDVSVLGQAAATFTLTDADVREEDIRTNIAADAVAFRMNFDSADGHFDKLVVGGTPRGGR